LKHAIGLLVRPELAPADPAVLAAAGRRLDDEKYGVDPVEYEAIAVAAAVAGRWSDAVKQQKKAIDRAETLAWNTARMSERLASYTAQRAWSGDLEDLPPRSTPAPPLKGRTIKTCAGDCGRGPDEKRKPMDTNIPR
jgi:hypothetical protein